MWGLCLFDATDCVSLFKVEKGMTKNQYSPPYFFRLFNEMDEERKNMFAGNKIYFFLFNSKFLLNRALCELTRAFKTTREYNFSFGKLIIACIKRIFGYSRHPMNCA